MNNMGKKIAIQGHEIKWGKILQILEILGGKLEDVLFGTNNSCFYYIDNGYIKFTDNYNEIKSLGYKIYTLNEYLQE